MEPSVTLNKTIRINIGGTTFKSYVKTLTTFPDSKLANLEKEKDSFDFDQNEYFFDRNPILFTYILDSFRKGAVHLPKDICGTTFKKELEFWEIPQHYVAPCCWEALYGSEDDIETVNLLIKSFQQNSNLALMSQEKMDVRTRLWLFLDEPKSSRYALVWSVFISFVILAATLVDSLSTVDSFQENFTEPQIKLLSKFADALDFDNATLEKLATIKPRTYLLYANAIFHVILTLELALSFIVCSNKRSFVCFTRLIACFGYMSYWISFTVYFNLKYLESIHALMVQLVFGYLSIFKIARLFYLTRGVPAFRLICLTFSSSKQELKILIFLLGIFVCVFGYVLFAAELLQNSNITNIFTAIYWALITLTTVGYGNYVPSTVAGHVIAGACAVCGVLVLALPVGIIVSKFYKYYDYHRYTVIHAQTREGPCLRMRKNTPSESNSLIEEIELVPTE
ncbi:potassium voltage-gated channel protein Shaw-like [Mercenaria mercenaria]|uniref:potassium voltage-gated channel protein Shaw-like n=1 Tax=Mercenaria mercenaria TaxID=6596 RepID=UPI00234EEE20|nr:potassium voltage-gated channel protein Shaw-like [Mercenaria mercenaria]